MSAKTAPKRKRRVRSPYIEEIVFKFRSSEIKALGGFEAFCEFIYSVVDAALIKEDN